MLSAPCSLPCALRPSLSALCSPPFAPCSALLSWAGAQVTKIQHMENHQTQSSQPANNADLTEVVADEDATEEDNERCPQPHFNPSGTVSFARIPNGPSAYPEEK